MGVSLRPIDSDDNLLLLQWRSDQRNARWFLSGAIPTETSQAQWFEHYLRRDDEILYMIELDEVGPIGTVGLSGIGAHHAEVGRVLIGEPEFRGKGFARAALDALEEIARTRFSIRRLSLEVLEDNEPARGLYERCGFGEVGIRAVLVNGVTRRAVIMAKRLEVLDVAS